MKRKPKTRVFFCFLLFFPDTLAVLSPPRGPEGRRLEGKLAAPPVRGFRATFSSSQKRKTDFGAKIVGLIFFLVVATEASF